MTTNTAQESWPKLLLTGGQMLFVAFGALVLVPLLMLPVYRRALRRQVAWKGREYRQ